MKSIRVPGGLEPLRDFRRTWPQLLLADLMARAAAVVVLAPVIALLLKLFLMRSATGVLSDEDILVFLVHPFGLFALVIVLAVVFATLFFEVGQLMVVGFGAAEDRRITYLDGLKYVVRHVGALIRLGRLAVMRILLLAAPFLAGVGAIYWLMLSEHDINYYLALKPPEFWRAVVLAGLVLAAMAVVLFRQFAAWLLALPMVLFGGLGGKRALRASRDATRGSHWAIAVALAAWLAAILVVGWIAGFVVGQLGRLLIGISDSLTWIAASLSLVLLTSGLVNLAVNVFATAMFPLLIVRLYRNMAGPGRLKPQLALAGSLGPRPSLRMPGKPILVGAIAIVLVTAAGSFYVGEHLDADDHAVVIAHRGASADAPENTMAAFRRALDENTDWIELDVQENADGVVVVQHDSDFMKQADVRTKVWEATNDELRDLDIGSWFSAEFADQRVPTLREALELARGKAGVFIELKYYGHDKALEKKVVKIVEQTEMQSSIVIMSLKYDGMRKTAKIRPDWTYGLLTSVNVGDPTRLDLDFLAVNSAAATPSLIRRAHQRGLKLYVWTVNDPVQMSVMMSRGVDGLITDKPALANRVKEIREGLSPLGRMVVWAAGESGWLRDWEPPPKDEDA